MEQDQVKLTIKDPAEPGHFAEFSMPRPRAEAIVYELVGTFGSRYEYAIESLRPAMGASPPPQKEPRVLRWEFVLGCLEAAAAFVKSHLYLIGLVLLVAAALLALWLPTPTNRAFPLVAYGFIAFALGIKAADARISELL